ncbi:hypothetical protein ACWGF2_31325 [Streptomyces sp. NPDC054919]
MIAHLQRASDTAGLLAYLYKPGERGVHTSPRLLAGDGHGASIELLAESGPLPLALALDAPVERLGPRAPERPVWLCSVRSNPGRPDLTDSQWDSVAHRLVAATGIAPEGDPNACRWVALRNQPRQVHVMATRVREDGSLHDAYRDTFRIHTELNRITTELGHMPTAPHSISHPQESPVPVPSITITAEPSGSVSAKGASDDLSASLLNHAGFQQIDDWHGRRHRLPTTTPFADRVTIATHAAEMLRAARYDVDLPPSLDATRMSPPVHPLGPYTAGAELLQITDRIRAAENGADLQRAVDHLLHPQHGALERVREALETAGEQVNDLDEEAYALADRFHFASEFVSSAQSELVYSEAEMRRVGTTSEAHTASQVRSSTLPDHRGPALATSPAAAKAKGSSALGSTTDQSNVAGHPLRVLGPRR